MKKKEIDEFIYKFVEIELLDGTRTVGQIVPDGNGYLLLTIYEDYPYVLKASRIKDIRPHEGDSIGVKTL